MLNDHKTAYVLAAILAFVVSIILTCCCRIISGKESHTVRIQKLGYRRKLEEKSKTAMTTPMY